PDFEADAVAGRKPTLEFYSNMTYFVPGTLSFKGFKTIAVTTSAGVMKSELSYIGLTSGMIGSLMQPVVIDTHGIGNPWLNYSYYLTPSFSFATFALLIMLFTAYSITEEIKSGTSVQWLATANDRISVALAGKLIPQSVVLIAVMLCAVAIMFRFLHFPMNGSLAMFSVAVVLFVLASQSFAVLICSALPNPRLAFSVISLLTVLTFSFAGFSFPVEDMYGAIAIFSYMMPVRYLFLIYVNTALNGFDTYFVRYYYVVLLAFIPVGYLLIGRLKKACLNPVYVP
ncbi:MAG: ABC transporter permease, partial [Muribaculaceae bacterium]|nr:ABC transporter permease [Muribaculaceae bacterium]